MSIPEKAFNAECAENNAEDAERSLTVSEAEPTILRVSGNRDGQVY